WRTDRRRLGDDPPGGEGLPDLADRPGQGDPDCARRLTMPRVGIVEPAVRLRDAELAFGDRCLWGGLTLDVAPGEFLAVLGPNGSGKTSLLKVLLGLQSLSAGSVSVSGRVPHRGSSAVGYVPQQKSFDRDLPLLGRDLVR